MDWTERDIWFWQTVTLIDGSKQRGGTVMRRRSNDGWEYRRQTEEEKRDFYWARQY